MDEKLREQVVQQCKAVAHMATALAQVHSDKADIIAKGGYDRPGLLVMVGRMTARYMESLGNILNGMDAVTEEDEWINPIMEEALRRWPGIDTSDPPSIHQ